MANSFPEGFAWGLATASYQIEGAVDEDGRGPSIWDTFARTPGKTANGDTGDIATDHYHLYEQDVDLMAEMGLTHYRFSIAWPRIQPTGSGAFNQAGFDFYQRLVDKLLENNIQPWVTLYHWDLPQPLEDAGGWPVRDTAERFADYAAETYERLNDRIQFWTTLNEPWCTAYLGYGNGVHAPGRVDPPAAIAAVHHLNLAHGLGIERMRSINADRQLGITLNTPIVAPATDSPEDKDAARRSDGFGLRIFLDPILLGRYPEDIVEDLRPHVDLSFLKEGDEKLIAQPIDVIGINYYNPSTVRKRTEPLPADARPAMYPGCEDIESVKQGFPESDMGWEIEPDALRRLLVKISTNYPATPLYVTENGMACKDVVAEDGTVDDPDRISYYDGHLRSCLQAIEEGVDLRGYFGWTFTDNFEWSFAFTKRFGLVYVDYATQERIPKSSAAWYTSVAKSNALPEAAV